MILIIRKSTYLFLFFLITSQQIACGQNKQVISQATKKTVLLPIKTGAERTELYLPRLRQKSVGVIANQTSVIFNGKKYIHLIDSLRTLGVSIKKVFAPEHGFRGKADAGAIVKNNTDTKTGLPIISLYGKNKKPTRQQLTDIDILLFDIQDVGVRFYTYISTLNYVMEAAAEAKIPVIVLDRPNPNGFYIDGPVLENQHKSFVGMHLVPIIYGMTIGEYAQMINGEKWLKNGIQCDLTVIPLQNYTHRSAYHLPIKPSPNLPNDKAINLYPSLCFFEGTTVSVGRGTNMQFQIYGSPYLMKTNFSFIPKPNQGAKYPKYRDTLCYGEDLRNTKKLQQLNLQWLIKSYKETDKRSNFFTPFFTKLAGTAVLQQQIMNGLSEKSIRKTWQKNLNNFKKIRSKYLIYK